MKIDIEPGINDMFWPVLNYFLKFLGSTASDPNILNRNPFHIFFLNKIFYHVIFNLLYFLKFLPPNGKFTNKFK